MPSRRRPDYRLRALASDVNDTVVKVPFLLRVYTKFGGSAYLEAERAYRKSGKNKSDMITFGYRIVDSMKGTSLNRIEGYVSRNIEKGLIPGSREALAKLKDKVTLALITDQIPPIAKPIAEALGIDHVYSSTSVEKDGKLTGSWMPLNKCLAASSFAESLGISLDEIGYLSDETELRGHVGFNFLINAEPHEDKKVDGKTVFSVKDFSELLDVVNTLVPENHN